uniref:Ig-like domain-containing protein n=1 Tax=Anabas testudineus TaxID=64144 RepID=A0A3Q1IGK6_ANATE
MEVIALYAASLNIDPNRAQFFQYESLTFYCEGVSYCEVVRESNGKTPSCNFSHKRTATGSSCTITNVFPADSGKYWFEGEGGNKSNSVIITVTAGSVILEIPALPVMEGEAVTLRCRNKTTSSQNSADFYNYGVLINSSSTGNMIIHNVSKSNEGLYKCSISGAGESAESWLMVKGETKKHLKIELLSRCRIYDNSYTRYSRHHIILVNCQIAVKMFGKYNTIDSSQHVRHGVNTWVQTRC